MRPLWTVLFFAVLFAFIYGSYWVRGRARRLSSRSIPLRDYDAEERKDTEMGDSISARCDFSWLGERDYGDIFKYRFPGSERYSVDFTFFPGDTVERSELVSTEGEPSHIEIGDAQGYYFSGDGFMSATLGDGNQSWAVQIYDRERSFDDFVQKRNYPPQEDMERIWRALEKHVKLGSDAQTLASLYDYFATHDERLLREGKTETYEDRYWRVADK